MAPRTIVTPGAGQTSVSVALPQGLGFKVQTVYAVIDTTGGATTPELTLADASGQVIATKPQPTALSASTSESATWALRLGDDGSGGGGGGFDKIEFLTSIPVNMPASGAGIAVPWVHQSGDTLLDLTTPTLPALLTDGSYVLFVDFSDDTAAPAANLSAIEATLTLDVAGAAHVLRSSTMENWPVTGNPGHFTIGTTALTAPYNFTAGMQISADLAQGSGVMRQGSLIAILARLSGSGGGGGGGGGTGVKVATVTLDTAAVTQLNSSPAVIVPGVAGSAIVVVSAQYALVVSGAPFVSGGGNLDLLTGLAATLQFQWPDTGFLDQAASQAVAGIGFGTGDQFSAGIDGQALLLREDAADPTGGAGSKLVVTVAYYLAPLV